MHYDWLAQAYASGPKMSKAGKKHHKAYMKHWSSRMKPNDPADLAHIEALAEEEEREKARIAAEKLAIDAARRERDGEEWEDIPPEQWEAGDLVKCVGSYPGSYTKGSVYKVRAIEDVDGFVFVSTESDDAGRQNGWSARHFRLRRRKNRPLELGDKVQLLPIDDLPDKMKKWLDASAVSKIIKIQVTIDKGGMLGVPSVGGVYDGTDRISGWWPTSHVKRVNS